VWRREEGEGKQSYRIAAGILLHSDCVLFHVSNVLVLFEAIELSLQQRCVERLRYYSSDSQFYFGGVL
jgi:hypothetical protein